MKPMMTLDEKIFDLRKKAESKLKRHKTPVYPAPEDNTQALLHELQVHRIELEIQNEELRTAQAQLEQTSHKYFKLFHEAPIGYVSLNLQGVIFESNRAFSEMVGEGKQKLNGTSFLTYLCPESRETYNNHVNRVLAAGKKQRCEVKVKRKNGRELHVEMQSCSYSGPEGSVSGICAALIDVTDQKRLARSNEDLEQFASVAAHDLQAPLREIMMFNDLLEGRAETADEKEIIIRVKAAAHRMQRLTRDLLKYAKASKESAGFQDADLKKIVDQVVADLGSHILERKAEIQVGDLPRINANIFQMRQLFQNLITNAIKYCLSREPCVRINSRTVDQEWCIEIEDNGEGFSEEFREKIFQPFHRLRHGHEGSGLGLAICRKIVERHGGSISAKSIPGKGSTFTIKLPRLSSK